MVCSLCHMIDSVCLVETACGRAPGCEDVWVTSIMGVGEEEGVPCKASYHILSIQSD